MTDNNLNRTVVRKEDLHQEVGTIRHASNNDNDPFLNGTNGLKHITEHNYHTTTIVRKEGMNESSANHTPDYSAPLPSYMGPAISSSAASATSDQPAPRPEPDYSAPLPSAADTYTSTHNDHTYQDKNISNNPMQSHNSSKPHDSSPSAHVSLNKVSDVPAEKGAGSKFVKILVILGILILLFFISIGIVKFVPKALGSLSTASVYLTNLFTKDGIELIVDKKTVKTGETINISWKNTSDKTGLYAWSFKCTDGITILYKSMDGSMKPVICETSFPIPENAIGYPFTVNSLRPGSIEVPMTLSLFDRETKELLYSDSAEITVTSSAAEPAPVPAVNQPAYNPNNTPATTTPATPSATSTQSRPNTPAGTPASALAPVGPTDMSITLVQANSIESGTINVRNLSNVGANDKVIVRFRIANNGPKATGAWRLTALLPTRIQADQAYTSNMQPSLQPGVSHEMTLMFDAYDSTKSQIAISIENPNDTVSGNNLLSIPISGPSAGTQSSRADLEVRILDVGLMNRSTGAFYPSSSLSQFDNVAVRFEVENKGGASTGYWSMRADLPTENDDHQIYGPLTSLAPGQKTQFTLGFDNPQTGSQIFTIQIDHNNSIQESNESNNSASRSLYINR